MKGGLVGESEHSPDSRHDYKRSIMGTLEYNRTLQMHKMNIIINVTFSVGFNFQVPYSGHLPAKHLSHRLNSHTNPTCCYTSEPCSVIGREDLRINQYLLLYTTSHEWQ
jgi:hypothetical protein